mgnify:CR=1 FL=1
MFCVLCFVFCVLCFVFCVVCCVFASCGVCHVLCAVPCVVFFVQKMQLMEAYLQAVNMGSHCKDVQANMVCFMHSCAFLIVQQMDEADVTAKMALQLSLRKWHSLPFATTTSFVIFSVRFFHFPVFCEMQCNPDGMSMFLHFSIQPLRHAPSLSADHRAAGVLAHHFGDQSRDSPSNWQSEQCVNAPTGDQGKFAHLEGKVGVMFCLDSPFPLFATRFPHLSFCCGLGVFLACLVLLWSLCLVHLLKFDAVSLECRLPNSWESANFWSGIVIWRSHIFQTMLQTLNYLMKNTCLFWLIPLHPC